jgi:hypothetical protein
MNRLKLLAIGACAALAFTINPTPVTAQKGEEHGHSHGTITVPETPDAILAQIHEHHMKIADLVKAKNLNAIHDHSDAVVTLAKALPDKVPADKKAAVTGPANNISKASAALHEASDAKDQAGAEAKFKNLESAIAQLEKKMK